jgi:hypothetical protein
VTESAILKRCPCPEHEGPNPPPVSEFHKNRRRRDGLADWCKTCMARAIQRYETADGRARRRETERRYRAGNREKVRASGRRRRRANPEQYRELDRRQKQANRESIRERARRRYWNLRDAVLDHYGRSCACCGSTERLTIDHVNGGGKAHRIALFGRSAVSTRMYRWLIEQGFPPGYQTLCGRCNTNKGDGPACRLAHFGAQLKYCRCPDHEGERMLALDEFGKSSRSPDGLESWCKTCKNRDGKQRRLRKAA